MMKSKRPDPIASLLALGLLAALILSVSCGDKPAPPGTSDAEAANPAEKSGAAKAKASNDTNAPSKTADAADAAANAAAMAKALATKAAGATNAMGTNATAAATNQLAKAKEPEKPKEVQVSFKGANIDMVVQWLVEQSGKSVVKHPTVNCKLTIVSSRKLPLPDALNLVYQALSLEGFSTIESSDAILIVPSGKEPRVSPAIMNSDESNMPSGRQRVVKVYELTHLTASEFQTRSKPLLSEKATSEVAGSDSKLMVTDFPENIRLLNELLPLLDVESSADTSVKVYPVKHLEADELANLLNQLMSDADPSPTSSRSSSSSSRSSSSRSSSSRFSPPRSSSSSSSRTPSTPPSGQIRIWPDATANRLIVSAPRSKQPEVEELIKLLDVEKPADVAVRILPLDHVDASQLVNEIGPLYRRLSGNSLKDIIEITANERSNSMIILSSESNYLQIQTFIKEIDTEDAVEQIMKTIELINADAQEVADQISELSNPQSSSNNRFPYYVSYSSRYSPTPKKMQVVADSRRNSLIVLASPSEMEGVLKIVKELDEPITDNGLAPKIYQLKYVNAEDIKEVLNELFLKKEQERDYWDYYGRGNSDDEDKVGRLFGKVRITSEPYSNSIIVTANSKESLDAVEEILKQLDSATEAGDSTLRVEIKFGNAVEIANNLNILFAKGGAPALRQTGQPQQNRTQQQGNNQNNQDNQSGFEIEERKEEEAYFPWLGGQQDNGRSRDGTTLRPPSNLVGRVRAVPDRRSNSLLLTADIHYFPQVIALINELDAPTAQVLIEARIIEVSSDFRDRLGVRWSPDGTIFDAEDLDGSLSATGTGGLMNTFLGSTAAGAFRSGVVDANMELNVLVQFLRKNTDATVLAEPKINVSDNELAKLFVGSQIPFISDVQNTPQGARNDAFQYRDVGVTLEVTPQINNSEEVALKIRAESSKIRSGETLFGAAILDTRNFRTDLLVKSGQTVILGGIIQEEDGQVVRKVPILGSIPILGWAFKKKDKTTRQVELMVFLRPVISRSPEEVDALTAEIERSTPRLKEWREESESTKAEEREEAERRAAKQKAKEAKKAQPRKIYWQKMTEEPNSATVVSPIPATTTTTTAAEPVKLEAAKSTDAAVKTEKPEDKEAPSRRWFWQKKAPEEEAKMAGPTKLELKPTTPEATSEKSPE